MMKCLPLQAQLSSGEEVNEQSERCDQKPVAQTMISGLRGNQVRSYRVLN